jgi:hypothetical protein
MDIKDYLHELRFILITRISPEEYYDDSIEGLIAKGQKDFDLAIKNAVGNIMKLIPVVLSKINMGF